MHISNDDSQFRQLSSDGDVALADVLEVHRERLLRIAELRLDRRLNGRVDCEDVLQEMFLEAQKRLARFLAKRQVTVFVWLRGVLIDTLVQIHRRHLCARKRDASVEVTVPGSADSYAAALATISSPSQHVMRDEMNQQVACALAGLSNNDREVLLMRHFEQLSNDEIAAVLGVKKAAASRRYTRAVSHLRKRIESLSGIGQPLRPETS